MQTDHDLSPPPATAPLWGGPDDVLDRLAGTWTLERVIAGKDGNAATLNGTATFRRIENGMMAYREEGRLLLPSGEAFDAFRDYLYDRVTQGFAVFFPESPPRLFHEIRLRADGGGALIGEAEHLCGRDRYATRFAFQPDGRFTLHHDVRGPRKDYAMATVYTRSLPLPRP
jgi:hypothetical protein